MNETKMGNRERLLELGWEHLVGAARAKASEVLGYDIGPDAYARKFGRKTVFMRDTGIFKLSVPMDRDDPSQTGVATGSKVYTRCFDIESVNDAAAALVARFHEQSSDQTGD